MAPLIMSLLPMLGNVLDKILPDPQAAADAKLKVMQMAQTGELAALDAETKLALGQIEVNKAEAAGGGYKANWRPTIGYVCAAALAFTYIVNPLLLWCVTLFGVGAEPPNIGIDDHLWELMMGMLGLAGWRTLDKVKGRG